MSAHVDSMTMSRMPDLVSQYTCTTSRFSSTRCAAVEDWVGRGGGRLTSWEESWAIVSSPTVVVVVVPRVVVMLVMTVFMDKYGDGEEEQEEERTIRRY